MDANEAVVLLERWGTWSRSNTDIGFPKENILSKAKNRGSFGPGSAHEIEMADDIAEVERVVCRMPNQMKKTVRTIYVYRVPQTEAATRFRVSRVEFRRMIDAASNYLAGAIGN